MTKLEFEANSFDVIYSRDAILYITEAEKNKLFQKFFHWLKPGGKILITDFCASPFPSKWSEVCMIDCDALKACTYMYCLLYLKLDF